MNVKDYIASGILEDYVMGSATEQERQEVECMSHIYTEIREELVILQEAVEALAMDTAIAPPEDLKGDLMSVLEGLEVPESEVEEDDTPVVSIAPPPKEEPKKTGAVWKIAMVAAVLIAAVTSVLLLNYKGAADQLASENTNLRNANNNLKASISKVMQANDSVQVALSNATNNLQIVTSPNTEVVPMTELEGKPDALATIYWNKQTQEVYLTVDHMFMPEQELQYQLWAIKDGQAVDCGVFEAGVDSTDIQKMYSIDRAEAFVVTLEKRGGVPVAEGEAYVIGTI